MRDVNLDGPPLADGWKLLWGTFVCEIIGHSFVEYADGFKRRCHRCNDEEWVFSNPFPKIGEPKYKWCKMNFWELSWRRR